MTERKQFEFQSQDRPRPVVVKIHKELAENGQTFFRIRALSKTADQSLYISLRSMLKERQEKVFLAFEMRVDCTLASSRGRCNLVQLGGFIPVAHEHFFGGIEQPSLRLTGPKLLFTQRFQGHLFQFSHPYFLVDKKLTGQYVSIMPQAAVLEVLPTAKAEKRTTRILIAGFAALLLGGGATGWGVYTEGFESTDDAQVDGHLNVVSSRIAGTTAVVYVTDNQTVEAGQPLVDLDPSERQVAYEQAKAQYDQAVAQLSSQRPNIAITQADNAAAAVTSEAQLARGRAAVAAASQDLASATARLAEADAIRSRDDAELQRHQQLFQAGTISRQDYDRSLAAAHSSDASFAAAKASVGSAEKVVEQRKAEIDEQAAHRNQVTQTAPRQLLIRQSDLATAEANVESATAQLNGAKLNLSFCHIVSPVRGVVSQRSAEIGNRVSEAQPLMMIVATSDTWVTANFKETQLASMRAGQPAKVHVDALKTDFAGTIEGIPAVTGARSSVLPPENATGNYIKVVQRMPVRIHLDANQDNLDRLRPGMSVEAKVWLR